MVPTFSDTQQEHEHTTTDIHPDNANQAVRLEKSARNTQTTNPLERQPSKDLAVLERPTTPCTPVDFLQLYYSNVPLSYDITLFVVASPIQWLVKKATGILEHLTFGNVFPSRCPTTPVNV